LAIAGGSVVVPALPAAYTAGAARAAAAAAVPGLEVLIAPPAKVIRRGKGVVNKTSVVDGDTVVKRSVDLGRAVQIDPIKPMSKAPGTKCFKMD